MNCKFVRVDQETDSGPTQWIKSLPVTVGRCPTADITIGDGSISRKHCQFLLDPYGTLSVHDTGSKNGVMVDGRRVEKSAITPLSEIRIGTICLRVEQTDEEADGFGGIEESADVPVYDLGETQKVRIFPPND